MRAVIVLTTVASSFDAAGYARQFVEARLAACVNIIERTRTIYRWENRIADEGEQLLIIKTTDERVAALKEALLAAHPYEVPEFVVIQVDDVSEMYRDWLVESTNDER